MNEDIVHQAWIALGSNLGDREACLELARNQLQELSVSIGAVSGIYVSESWGYRSDHRFYNQCLVMETRLVPRELLHALKRIERELGREEGREGYADRVIDLDILFIDDLVISEADLKVPHPLIGERMFVLKPLHEISPEKVHPVSGQTVSQMYHHCNDKGEVRRLPSV